MKCRAAAYALLLGLALSGCGNPSTGSPDADPRAASLWSDRTPYVGDNSKMVALVSQAGFGPTDAYTIELQTERAPYGVTVKFHSLSKSFDSTDFRQQATLLLGLVDNLDHVDVRSDAHVYSLTAADASKRLGYDVKALGRDKGKLIAYVNAQQD